MYTNKLKVLLSVLLSVVFGMGSAHAQLMSWQFGSPAAAGTETSYAATYANPHITALPLTRGAGLIPSGLARGFSSSDFTLNGTKDSAIANGDYYQVGLTVGTGYRASLYNIDIHTRTSSTVAATTSRWMYSFNGTSFTEIDTADIAYVGAAGNDGNDQAQVLLSNVPALQNLPEGTTVTLRLYMWGAGTTSSTVAIGRQAAGSLAPSLAVGGRVTPVAASRLLGWQFATPASVGNESTYAATFAASGVAASTLSRGTGAATAATTLPRGFVASNFTLNGTKANAISNGEYYQFTIKSAIATLRLTTLDCRLRRSAAGANTYRWMYSLDSVNFTDAGSSDVSFTSTFDGVDQPQIDLSTITALQNIAPNTTVTFRLYAWGATTTAGTFAIGRYIADAAVNSLEVQGRVINNLPLTLIAFSANNNNGKVGIEWKTAGETNVDRFIVEKSNDGQAFSTLKELAAQNKPGQNQYSTTDQLTAEGAVYYRLKMIDKDGSFSYSQVAVVAGNNNNVSLTVYPNPVSNECRVVLPVAESNAILYVMDQQGRVLIQTNIPQGSTSSVVSCGHLAPGTYLLVYANGAEKHTTTLQKQ